MWCSDSRFSWKLCPHSFSFRALPPPPSLPPPTPISLCACDVALIYASSAASPGFLGLLDALPWPRSSHPCHRTPINRPPPPSPLRLYPRYLHACVDGLSWSNRTGSGNPESLLLASRSPEPVQFPSTQPFHMKTTWMTENLHRITHKPKNKLPPFASSRAENQP